MDNDTFLILLKSIKEMAIRLIDMSKDMNLMMSILKGFDSRLQNLESKIEQKQDKITMCGQGA